MNEGACSSWSEEPVSPANQSGISSEADLSTDDEIYVLNENTNDLQLRFVNSEEIKRDHRLFDERRHEKEYAWLYYNFSKNGFYVKFVRFFMEVQVKNLGEVEEHGRIEQFILKITLARN